MKRVIVLAALSLAACGGVAPPGDTGTSGGTSGTSTQCLCNNDPPDSGVNCTPGAVFCDGDKGWICTKTGRDAILYDDCARYGSANNPGICITADGGAYCGRAQPTCVADITSPTTATTCTMTPPAVDGCGRSNHYWRFVVPLTADACSTDAFTIVFSDSGHTTGEAIDLSSSSVTASVQYQGASSSSCTGTLTWSQDLPSPKFDVNAACGSIQVVGTVDGHF